MRVTSRGRGPLLGTPHPSLTTRILPVRYEKGSQAARASGCGTHDGQARREGQERRRDAGHGRGWGPGGRAHATGAETRGEQRGGAWARVRGVDAGETRGTAMCAPNPPASHSPKWRIAKFNPIRINPTSSINNESIQICARPKHAPLEGWLNDAHLTHSTLQPP